MSLASNDCLYNARYRLIWPNIVEVVRRRRATAKTMAMVGEIARCTTSSLPTLCYDCWFTFEYVCCDGQLMPSNQLSQWTMNTFDHLKHINTMDVVGLQFITRMIRRIHHEPALCLWCTGFVMTVRFTGHWGQLNKHTILMQLHNCPKSLE